MTENAFAARVAAALAAASDAYIDAAYAALGLNEPMVYTLADMTQEFAESFYYDAIDGWYDDGPIDWEDAIERWERGVDGIDFGDQWDSPVIRKLKRLIRAIRADAG